MPEFCLMDSRTMAAYWPLNTTLTTRGKCWARQALQQPYYSHPSPGERNDRASGQANTKRSTVLLLRRGLPRDRRRRGRETPSSSMRWNIIRGTAKCVRHDVAVRFLSITIHRSIDVTHDCVFTTRAVIGCRTRTLTFLRRVVDDCEREPTVSRPTLLSLSLCACVCVSLSLMLMLLTIMLLG